MITSPHNEKLKEVRRLQRKRSSRFVAEGEDLLAAAHAAGWAPVYELHAGVEVDRKILADIAVRDAEAFRRFAERAREALAAAA